MSYPTPKHVELLEEALRRGGNTHTIFDVLQDMEQGLVQAHFTDKSVIVTELQDYPSGRNVHLWLAGGEMDDVIELSHRVLRWAKEEYGCSTATLAGRKGWSRVLANQGWTPTAVLMRKEIA